MNFSLSLMYPPKKLFFPIETASLYYKNNPIAGGGVSMDLNK